MRYKYILSSLEEGTAQAILLVGRKHWENLGGFMQSNCPVTNDSYKIVSGWSEDPHFNCPLGLRKAEPVCSACSQPAASAKSTTWTPQRSFPPQPLQCREEMKGKQTAPHTHEPVLLLPSRAVQLQVSKLTAEPIPCVLSCSREKGTRIKQSHSSYPVPICCTI